MKCLYLASLLLLAVTWCQGKPSESSESNELQDITKTKASNEDDETAEFFAEVKALFEKKCHAQGGDSAVKNLSDVLDKVKTCLSEHLPKDREELKDLKDSGSSSEELCAEKRPKVRECFNDFVHIWQECSEPEEKYLPDFVFDALDALYDYVCADDGAVILKVFQDSTLECVISLSENENITEVCSDQFKFLKDDTPDDITITKAELCEDLTTAKNCYGKYIEKQCPKDTNFKDIVVGLYTAISSPCTKNPKNPLNLNLPGGN